MIKFFLILKLCSLVMGNCLPPIPHGYYSSYYDCGIAGYLQSIGTLQAIGPEDVNKNKLYIKFYCNELTSS